MVECEGMNIEIIKSKRKTIAIQIIDSENVRVRAPYRVSQKDIQDFIDRNMEWIIEKQAKARKQDAEIVSENIRPLTQLELDELADRACVVFQERVNYYAPIVGVTFGRITIRNQKSRWGSCSAKGNLNFNVALMRAPLEVLDYVVVHELCHRIELNHSARFWKEVERVLPNYKEQEKWLKEHGKKILAETHG